MAGPREHGLIGGVGLLAHGLGGHNADPGALRQAQTISYCLLVRVVCQDVPRQPNSDAFRSRVWSPADTSPEQLCTASPEEKHSTTDTSESRHGGPFLWSLRPQVTGGMYQVVPPDIGSAFRFASMPSTAHWYRSRVNSMPQPQRSVSGRTPSHSRTDEGPCDPGPTYRNASEGSWLHVYFAEDLRTLGPVVLA